MLDRAGYLDHEICEESIVYCLGNDKIDKEWQDITDVAEDMGYMG
jgi:hypothetical protein